VAPETPEPPAPAAATIAPIKVETQTLEPLAAGKQPALPPGDEKPAPHIALLLPLKSADFGAAADAVQLGFLAAANLEITNPHPFSLPVRVYGSFDESKDIVTLYRRAIANGARAVAGPLTRTGVGVLAAERDIPVPTLALNIADGQFAGQLYFFGMMVEEEARRVAQLARQQDLRAAVVVTTNSYLSTRLQFAFEDEWLNLGGTLQQRIEFDGDTAVLAGISETPGAMVFLAADADKARLIRPYLPAILPIYATSRIFLGNNDTLVNFDLDGIHFVDMPWLLQADHPAVMVYPRADRQLSTDHERFYALGIDAFRLVQLMLAGKVGDKLSLDGVSGDLWLNGQIFQRTAIPAIFTQGQAQFGNSRSVPAVPVFPDQAPAASRE